MNSQITLARDAIKIVHSVKYSVQSLEFSVLRVDGSECLSFSCNLALMDTGLEALWFPETLHI